MGWVTVVFKAILFFVKSIFGTDKPQKNTVTHPKPEVEIDDGKTDKERMEDLGL